LALSRADDVIRWRQHCREVGCSHVVPERAEGTEVGHARMVATISESGRRGTVASDADQSSALDATLVR
jgi:hypothetical protein